MTRPGFGYAYFEIGHVPAAPSYRGHHLELHFSTELRVAWRRGLETALAAEPPAVAPYKILRGAFAAVKEVVDARLRLFSLGSVRG